MKILRPIQNFISNRKQGTILLCLLLCICAAQSQNMKFDPFSYEITKRIICKKGAVVSAHTLASQVGVSILQQGGNAVDAAIGTQLALAVVYAEAGNIGGGGFMVAHFKNVRLANGEGKNITLDVREMAPGAATRDMYLDANGNPQTNLSLEGHLS